MRVQLAHSFRIRAGIPSGPTALFTSRFLSKSATSAAVKVILTNVVSLHSYVPRCLNQ